MSESSHWIFSQRFFSHQAVRAALLCTAVVAFGCGGAGRPSAEAGTEAGLRDRAASYWDLRLSGDTLRLYQEFMSERFREDRSIEDFVSNAHGAAVYTGYRIAKLAIDEDDPSRARVLVEYDWHVNPEMFNVSPNPKTARAESIWVFEEGLWKFDETVDEGETKLM